MEKIGIYITTYNRAQYLGQTIESILNQTYKCFNLYILDNRSSDNTKVIVDSYKDNRIKYILNEDNLGMVGNWNKALCVCQEKYITIFHDDDIMMKDYLNHVVMLYNKNPNIIFLHTGAVIINSEGKNIGIKLGNWEESVQGLEFFKSHLIKGGLIFAPSVTLKVEKLPRFEKFDENLPFTSDVNFWLRISKYGDVGYINKPLIKYRIHNLSGTNSIYYNLDSKIKDRQYYKNFLVHEINRRELKSYRFKKIPIKYLRSALTADILYIKMQTRSVKKVLKSILRIINAQPDVLITIRFYFTCLLSLLPNFILDIIRNIKKNYKLLKTNGSGHK